MYDPATSTLMEVSPGETYTLRDLIYGMMLPSGNDAAHAIARTLGHQEGDTPDESVARFMSWINQRNADLGLTNTNLVNPTGWGEEGHYSTARDVATFMRYAMGFPDLVEAMGTRSYTTENGALTVTNSNRLLSEWDLTDGGKTGYDWDSGYCLIEFASRDDATMISVTLDGIAPGDWYDDNKVLLTYAFDTRIARLEQDQEFEGEIATYTDPAAAELSRAARIGGSFAAGEENVVLETSGSDPAAALPGPEPVEEAASSPLSPSRPALWIAIGTVLFLVAARGFWTFRHHDRQLRVDSDHVQT
jgi:D-alanyl-D-alanine carboxypeptidase